MNGVDDFYKWLEVENSDVPTKRRGRKPSKKQYFTYVTDIYVIKSIENILIIRLIN
jgi:hypothetical protein